MRIIGRVINRFRSNRTRALKVEFVSAKSHKQYVAYLDVLGFANLTLTDFNATVEAYSEAFSQVRTSVDGSSKASIQIYSDTVLVTSPDFRSCINTAQMMNFYLMINGYLIRGGLAYGMHKHLAKGADNFVVSEALTRASRLEKSIKYPCIALDSSISIPVEWWVPHWNPFARPLLYFKGITFVSPFLITWGRSARNRVSLMKERYPQHAEKYDWILDLYDACYRNELLIPPDVMCQLTRSAS